MRFNTHETQLSQSIKQTIRPTFNKVAAVASLVTINALTVTPAFAQEEFRMLEEVVVTARRREENLQDIPVAVSAMDEDYLRTQNITEIEQLGTNVPSMRISSAGTDTNTPVVTIRGQRPSEAKIELDPAAPMYVNDVVMSPSTGTNLAMYDLQGVQVLKGPQGTLFGRNSTGGAILLTTKRPSNEFGGYVEAKVGNYDLRHLEGAVDVPLSDEFSARISGRMVDRDGYQENIADNELKGDDARGEDSESIRVSLAYDGDRLTNLAVMSYDKNEAGSAVPQIVAVNTSSNGALFDTFTAGGYSESVQEILDRDDPWEFESDVEAVDIVKNQFFSNTTEFEINDNVSIKNIFGYRKVERNAVNDADGTIHPLSGAITDATLLDQAVTTLNPDLNKTQAEQFSNELQMLGSAFDENLDWIVGAYWYEMDGTVKENLQQILGVAYDYSTYDAVNTAKGLFAEGTFILSDEWSVTAGVRQSWDEREITVRKREVRGLSLTVPTIDDSTCAVYAKGAVPGVDAPLPNDACARTVDESFSSPTWRVSANYTPVDGHLLYLSAATGYKAGGFNARGTNDTGLEPFDEEKVLTWEFGHKGDWSLGNTPVRTNLAVFLQEYKDIQQTISIASGNTLATQTVNAAEAEIKGLEFDVTVSPTDNLLLNLAYSYIDAGFKENVKVEGGVEYDISDNDFVYIPEQSLTASVAYTLPVDSSMGEMTVNASMYWQDSMSTHPLAGDFDEIYGSVWTAENVAKAERFSEVDDYAVYNLRFDWRNVMGSNFDAAIFGNNITDEEYVIGGLNVIEVFYTGFTYGAPRTYGASLRYNF